MRIRVVDLETTGLESEAGAKVVEIGWCDLVDGAIGAPEQRIINPGIPVPPEASAVHHLTDEDVAAGEDFDRTIRRVVGNPELTAVCAHNAAFERQWVGSPVPWICTLKCAYALWPEAPSHSNQALRYWLKPEGLDREIADKAHRAGPDAYVTAFLLREMLKVHTVEELIAISDRPVLLPRCRTGKFYGKPWAEVETGFLEWMLGKDFDEDTKFTVKHELERRRTVQPA